MKDVTPLHVTSSINRPTNLMTLLKWLLNEAYLQDYVRFGCFSVIQTANTVNNPVNHSHRYIHELYYLVFEHNNGCLT